MTSPFTNSMRTAIIIVGVLAAIFCVGVYVFLQMPSSLEKRYKAAEYFLTVQTVNTKDPTSYLENVRHRAIETLKLSNAESLQQPKLYSATVDLGPNHEIYLIAHWIEDASTVESLTIECGNKQVLKFPLDHLDLEQNRNNAKETVLRGALFRIKKGQEPEYSFLLDVSKNGGKVHLNNSADLITIDVLDDTDLKP